MLDADENLPDDVGELQAMVRATRAALRARDLLIEQLKHRLTGHRHHRFGARSETLDQLELTLEDTEIGSAAEALPSGGSPSDRKPRRRPKRRPLPDHLPRDERTLSPSEHCERCGGTLKKLGEDVTEELEFIPARFVVKRIVRPRMACACCETFHQAALPSRSIERGRPGPGLLANVLVSKYADHLPLYRQSQIYAREGIDLDRSTLADWVSKATALMAPLADAIGCHVLQGQAIFADDTPVNLLSPGRGKTTTGRAWVYVRDERPWAGDAPPAAFYHFSSDRRGAHPQTHLANFAGWMHADGYAGFEGVFRSGAITEVACMAHIRRKFVDVHRSQGSTICCPGVSGHAQNKRARSGAARRLF